jgi:hypothetical protein
MAKQLDLSSEWVRAFSFRSFVQRHHRLLTFLGAVIVFITFIVKEGIRERLKNIGDSVSSAENVFIARSEASRLPTYLVHVNRRVGVVERMVMKLSNKETISSTTLPTENEVEEVEIKRVALVQAAIENMNYGDPTDEHKARETLLGADFLSERCDNIMREDIEPLEKQIMGEARRVETEYDKFYGLSTWFSYGLYAIGWGIALIGRIYSVEISGGE